MTNRLKISLFGAAPDTVNMGVSAMFASIVSGVAALRPSVQFVVFDNGRGRRSGSLLLEGGSRIEFMRAGARPGRRYYLTENVATMSVLSRFGKLGASLNSNLEIVDSSNAVFDVSGGDSFSDIYGASRFRFIAREKLIALRRNVPLILMPQTYGPYLDPGAKKVASQIVRGATMAWARDAHSFENLKGLLGDAFDASRHRCGVDVAFALVPRCAEQKIDPLLASWIDDKNDSTPIVGFNVNGLIYNDPEQARSHYRFKADYQESIKRFLTWLLTEKDARVVLVSHVMGPPGTLESDLAAGQHVASLLPEDCRDRVLVSGLDLDYSEVKWLISKMDWFCGTRMHSTIAALSSEVPTATICYSDKAQGVFETCEQGEHAFDPRVLDTEEVVDGLKKSFLSREAAEASLVRVMPQVWKQTENQLVLILDAIAPCP